VILVYLFLLHFVSVIVLFFLQPFVSWCSIESSREWNVLLEQILSIHNISYTLVCCRMLCNATACHMWYLWIINLSILMFGVWLWLYRASTHMQMRLTQKEFIRSYHVLLMTLSGSLRRSGHLPVCQPDLINIVWSVF